MSKITSVIFLHGNSAALLQHSGGVSPIYLLFSSYNSQILLTIIDWWYKCHVGQCSLPKHIWYTWRFRSWLYWWLHQKSWSRIYGSTLALQMAQLQSKLSSLTSPHSRSVLMLCEILGTQCANRALHWLLASSMVLLVGGSANSSLYIISCHKFHEKLCNFLLFSAN